MHQTFFDLSPTFTQREDTNKLSDIEFLNVLQGLSLTVYSQDISLNCIQLYLDKAKILCLKYFL